jgi:hypothetical protein
MDSIGLDQIIAVLFGDEDPLIREKFKDNYSSELETFIVLMTQAFEEWSRVDEIFTKKKTEPDAYITALLYTALHSHVVSLKLFISGLLVPSGNTQRYVFECIALAFLLSRPSLGVVERYMNDQYSTTKAIRDVIRNHKALKLDREGLKVLESSLKFYDKFSHPTRLSLGGVIHLAANGSQIIFGGAYDEDKEFAYRKEIKSKLGFAEILPNLIQGVELNYGIEA